MQKKLRVGVVGVGKLGALHVSVLREMPFVELTGIFDRNPVRLSEVAREWDVRSFPSIEELVPRVEAVVIAVPTQDHARVAVPFLEAGRHIFVEKPVTATLDEADRLVTLAQQKAVTFQVGHIERFNPAFLSLRGEELRPLFIESHRLSSFDPRGTDVAVVLDLMIHDIDLILSLINSPVERIDATGVAVVSHEADIANARLRFANGCVANLTASRISLKKMRKMRIFQKNVYLTLDFLEKQAEIYRLQEAGEDMPDTALAFGTIENAGVRKQVLYEKRTRENTNALKEELKAFVEAVLEGKTPPVSGEDGRRALQVALQIMEQVKANQKMYV